MPPLPPPYQTIRSPSSQPSEAASIGQQTPVIFDPELGLPWPLSRTGFLTRLKCKKVRIDKEKMLRMIIREKLSKRAVMKENGLR